MAKEHQIPSSVYSKHFGEYPIQEPNEKITQERWPAILAERSKKIIEANLDIANKFEDEFGPNADIAIAARIFADLSPSLMQISIDQYQIQKPKKSYSWEDVSPVGVQKLKGKIKENLENPEYKAFFEENEAIKTALLLFIDISDIKDEKTLLERSMEYDEVCRVAINSGKIIFFTNYLLKGFYITFEKDRKVTRDISETPMFEITLDLFIPPTQKDRKTFEEYNNLAIDNLSLMSGENLDHMRGRNIFGYTIMSAGFSAMSQTESMSLDSGGFFWSINSYKERHQKFWQKALELSGQDPTTNYTTARAAYLSSHENGHNVYPATNELEEILTDIPAVIFLLVNLPEKTQYQFDPRQGICILLADFIFEVGKKRNKNIAFDGYINSNVYLVNKFLEHKIIILNEDGTFKIDTDINKITTLATDIQKTHKKLIENDRKTRKYINTLEPSPESLHLAKILTNFSN